VPVVRVGDKNVSFPDGMDADEIEAALAAEMLGSVAPRGKPPEKPKQITGMKINRGEKVKGIPLITDIEFTFDEED